MIRFLLGLLLCMALVAPHYPAQAANVGNTLPAYSFERLEGGAVELPPKDGKIYVINLWATWCPPCRTEMPDLQAFYDKYKDSSNVGIYLINHAEQPNKIREFLRKGNFSMPVLLDPAGQGAKMLSTRALPTTVVVDASGKVLFRKVGAVTLSELERAVVRN